MVTRDVTSIIVDSALFFRRKNFGLNPFCPAWQRNYKVLLKRILDRQKRTVSNLRAQLQSTIIDSDLEPKSKRSYFTQHSTFWRSNCQLHKSCHTVNPPCYLVSDQTTKLLPDLSSLLLPDLSLLWLNTVTEYHPCSKSADKYNKSKLVTDFTEEPHKRGRMCQDSWEELEKFYDLDFRLITILVKS